MSTTFASLKFYNYRLWFVATMIASTGQWMQRVAQDWLVLVVLTNGSGTALGITTALQFFPILLFSPWAGVIVDRADRRKLLQFTQSMNGVMSLILGALVLTGVAQLWHVYLLAFVSGALATVDAPARQTFVSELVPKGSVPNAVGLNSAAFNVARLLGPATSGLVIAWVGPGWVFIVNVLLFLAPVIAMMLMKVELLTPMKLVKRKKGQIREGLRYVKNRSDIIVIMIVAGFVSAFGMNFQMTSAVMATEVYGKGPGEYGILGSFMAIGALGGALLAARRKFPRVRLVVVAAFLFGIFDIALGLAPTYETFALLSIPTGLAMLTMVTAANASIQVSTDPDMRGRVMALYMMVFLGSNPVGAPIIGWIADAWGGRWSLLAGGIVAIVVSVIAAIWAIKTWDVRIEARLSRHPIRTYGPRERARDMQAAREQQQTD
ncbi:MAG: MFS transporter [Actinomycetaceae bacterium]|nr:MFS transporter [Actinomycetaceae bacterium]